MPSVSFDRSVVGNGQFSRGVATKDYGGNDVAADEPRYLSDRIMVGEPTSYVELYDNTNYVTRIMATGVTYEGDRNINILEEWATQNGNVYLNVFVGDMIALVQSGAPSLTSGYGYKSVNGSEWFRYEGVPVGSGDVTGSMSEFSINIVHDYGDAASELRQGTQGQTIAEDIASSNVTPSEVVIRPGYGQCYRGCVILAAEAMRLSAETGGPDFGSGATNIYQADGAMALMWQYPGDTGSSSGHWEVIRDQDDFTNETSGIKHDLQRGRLTGEPWSGPRFSTPWVRTSEARNIVYCAFADYKKNGTAAGPTINISGTDNEGGRSGLFIGFELVYSNGSWSASAPLHFESDATASTNDNGFNHHRHTCIIAEAYDSGGDQSIAAYIGDGDTDYYNGMHRFVYDNTGLWSGAVVEGFETPSNWESRQDILGSVNRYGSKPMSFNQGKEVGHILIGSDTQSSHIRDMKVDVQNPIDMTLTGVYGASVEPEVNSFVLTPDRPADPTCQYICDRYIPNWVADGGGGTLDSEARSKSLMYSPDAGETWVPWVKSFGDNVTYGFSGSYGIIGSRGNGVRAYPLPKVAKAKPILLNRGYDNVLIDDPYTSDTADTTATEMSRNGNGQFVDTDFTPDLVLPKDFAIGQSVAIADKNAGTGGATLVKAGSTTSTNQSNEGGLTVDTKQRTAIFNVLAARDSGGVPQAVPVVCEFVNQGADTTSVNPQNMKSVGETTCIFTQTENWEQVAWAIPHSFGVGDLTDTSLTLRWSTTRAGTRPRENYFIPAGLYEGKGWPGYPTSPGSDTSSNPETVALGWDVQNGKSILGGFLIGPFFNPYMSWYDDGDTDPAADLVERVLTWLEVGDPTSTDYAIFEFVWGSGATDGAPNTDVQLRVRGKANNAAFSETVDLDGDNNEFVPGWLETPVLFKLDFASTGITVSLCMEGLSIRQAIANTSSIGTMTLKQIGADYDDASSYAGEMAWFGIKTVNTSSTTTDEAMLNLEFLEQGGIKRQSGRGPIAVSGR